MLNFPKDNFVFLETNKFNKDNFRSFLFVKPTKIISCYRLKDVKPAFLEIEHSISRGYYAAGFISYEAGFSFEDQLKDLKSDSKFPLLWFGIYKKPIIVTHRERMDLLQNKKVPYSIKNIHPNISKKEYIDNIKKIKSFIRKGDTYQVNYTYKYKFDFHGSLHSFYEDLKAKQSVSYTSFIKTPEFSILSISPELFFRKDNQSIEVRPMKGTINRGRTLEEDNNNMKALGQSLKNRSENVMIVDLLRNDLGRVSRSGTVKTKRLFEVERYETLLQMISIVRSSLKKNLTPYDLFKAIFPSGSVTGAPKINTMKIIDSLEKEMRYVYTGGVGFFAPDREAVFNVAIRTVLIDNKNNKGEMGVGSGIVYDADPYKEFEECKLKVNFLTQKKNDFRLIETILHKPRKGYFLLKLHIDRLLKSSEYFNFRCDKKYILKELKKLEKSFKDSFSYKVRLLLDRDGRIKLSFSRINTNGKLAKVRFSSKKTSKEDTFLYNKTTNRDLYNKEHKKWSKKGYFDIIFTNRQNQVTEGAISNVIIKKRDFYYTPPVECGLLNGVFRRYILENDKLPIKEKILYRDDIKKADEVYMINSVRGMVKVKI